MFSSAHASVGGKHSNDLRLKGVRHSIVILIDGLGYENLTSAKAYARFLNSCHSEVIRTEFPSTTATSITGFATGTRSDVHGVIGYSVFDRLAKVGVNLLSGWSSIEDANAFKQAIDISESAGDVRVRVIGPSIYENSGFTAMTMAAAEYLAAESIEQRLALALELPSTPSLTYLYLPELDQLAHRFGVASQNWLHQLEEVDSLISNFSRAVPGSTGVIVVADHGVIDVSQEGQVMLDEYRWYTDAVAYTAGDPRCNFIYLDVDAAIEVLQEQLIREFGSVAFVCTIHQLKNSGWADWTKLERTNLVPDLVLIWDSPRVGYDKRFAKPTHLKMIGQHGGISDAETRIPLIRFGAY